MVTDPVLRGFLERQAEEGRALAAASDILSLECLPTGQHFLAHFACSGLVQEVDQTVHEATGFLVGIYFGADYLRGLSFNPCEVLTLIRPANTFHPNIGAPFICVGAIPPGTKLIDLLFQVYEVLSGQRVTMREDDALSKQACRWWRENNPDRIPVDPRPLLRCSPALEVLRG